MDIKSTQKAKNSLKSRVKMKFKGAVQNLHF